MKNIKTKIVFAMILISFLLAMSVNYNLKKYSIHYAQNIPHSKYADPVICTMMNNLEWINIPNDIENKNCEYSYDTLGRINGILIKEENQKKSIYSDGYISIESEDGEKEFYWFDEEGRLKRSWENGIFVTQKDFERAKEIAFSVVQPYIDNQYKPGLNLQWLFNLRYYDQFN